jgi:dTDP-4-dehydrorhamnose reductase
MSMVKKQKFYNPEVWGGIECTINRVGDAFFDQLEYANYYQKPGSEIVADLGIKRIRFPILWERHLPVLNKDIDWHWTEQQVEIFKKNNIEVIAGLTHHGSGPAYTNLLDDNFPIYLSQYALEVARKFPFIRYYTPVNEPLTTARFSGLYGLWYPHLTDERSFILMLLNQLKGVVLSMKAIRSINPEAQLVQTEDLGKTYSTPLLKYQADFENCRRWLTYDLLLGKVDKNHPLWGHFKWLKIPESLLHFFLENVCEPEVIGFNYYITSERYIDEKTDLYPTHTHGGNGRHSYADVEAVRVELEEETGLKVLLTEAWQRYQRPIAITEVHLYCHREEQLRWFQYVWDTCTELKQKGADIKGVTAWAILGSYGWNKLLTQPNGEYEPGVFDLRGGYPRRTALCSHIKNLTSEAQSSHPLTKNEGWWQRSSRFLFDVQRSSVQSVISTRRKSQPLLIIGKRGTLGKAFAKVCVQRCIDYVLLSRGDCDIALPETIEKVINKYKPWAIINAAGYVRIDDAEQEPEQCFRENLKGPVNLAIACEKYGIKLLTFSSDLVFDGAKGKPYTESDAINPLNIYGKSKAESEVKIRDANNQSLIIRTSAFFGPWDQYNFLHWVETNVSNQIPVPVASDVYVSPTYVPDLVHTALDLLVDDENGIWHLSNSGAVTWYDLAKEALDHLGIDKRLLIPMSVDDMCLPANRPKFSVLGSEKAILLPGLESALHRYFEEKESLVEV